MSQCPVTVFRSRTGSRVRLAVYLAVAAIGASVITACTTGSTAGSPSSSVLPSTSSSGSSSSQPAQPGSSVASKPTEVVAVTALESDGATYGVGMPIVLYFKPAPTNSAAFVNAVKVTDNDQPVQGAWYWEQPDQDEVRRGVVEAHFRPKTSAPASSPNAYWPADSQVHVDIPIGGLSAGSTKKNDLVYSDKLTSLDYRIGDAHISTVDANSGQMTVTSNGKAKNQFRAGLGAAKTPTYRGTKVVMQKGEDNPSTGKPRPDGAVTMQGPGYGPELVDWSVRITQSGEYVHAAPWNPDQTATSNGCTNLSTSNAEWFYNFSQIGDVVTYPNAPGPAMRPDDGLGDWNISWTTWARGGLLANP